MLGYNLGREELSVIREQSSLAVEQREATVDAVSDVAGGGTGDPVCPEEERLGGWAGSGSGAAGGWKLALSQGDRERGGVLGKPGQVWQEREAQRRPQ